MTAHNRDSAPDSQDSVEHICAALRHAAYGYAVDRANRRDALAKLREIANLDAELLQIAAATMITEGRTSPDHNDVIVMYAAALLLAASNL